MDLGNLIVLLNLIFDNKDFLIQLFTTIVAIASIIVKATPEYTNNKYINKFIEFANFLALNKSKKIETENKENLDIKKEE